MKQIKLKEAQLNLHRFLKEKKPFEIISGENRVVGVVTFVQDGTASFSQTRPIPVESPQIEDGPVEESHFCIQCKKIALYRTKDKIEDEQMNEVYFFACQFHYNAMPNKRLFIKL